MQLMTVRYEIGGREREEVVVMDGFSLPDHVDRLESPSRGGLVDFVVFGRLARPSIAIRLDRIVALDVHDEDE
ncbi:hypothetical protein ACFYWO_39935 [Streptomyces sp. NPDC002932]|uniref:hypothetical protein n=1 Tax=Streptomyces sp. NPDC002932 TaxID=3364672 RepID=UPI0036997FAB